MELAEAERAAVEEGRRLARAGSRVADVDEPQDPVEAWEFHVRCQFRGLLRWARRKGCLLRLRDLPERDFGPGGREHIIYHDVVHGRFWKVTFPNTSGIGPSGFFTPAGYLNRLRLSNRIFGDDVRFEGILAEGRNQHCHLSTLRASAPRAIHSHRIRNCSMYARIWIQAGVRDHVDSGRWRLRG